MSGHRVKEIIPQRANEARWAGDYRQGVTMTLMQVKAERERLCALWVCGTHRHRPYASPARRRVVGRAGRCDDHLRLSGRASVAERIGHADNQRRVGLDAR